jgi:hypothetical protein
MTEEYDAKHYAEEDDQNLVPVEHQKPVSGMLSNATYDKLKPLTTVVMPAIITFWLTMANIWNWPNVEEIAATLGAVNVLMGVVLSVSTRSYNKSDAKYDGVINVYHNDEGRPVASMELKNYEDPAQVVQQKEVTFKVNGQ